MAGILSFINTDLILVKKLLPEIQAGLYSVLSLFAKMVGYFLQPIADVAFSFGAAKETKKHQHKNLFFTTVIFLLAGTTATVIYHFFAPQLIIIFTKKDYLPISNLLPLAAIFGTLYMLNTLYSKHFLNQNHLIASLAFILCLAQALSIFIFHTNFTQIMTINIVTSALLFLSYFIFYFQKKPS
jgi:O-antigen/teichoic acid export membrane protein